MTSLLRMRYPCADARPPVPHQPIYLVTFIFSSWKDLNFLPPPRGYQCVCVWVWKGEGGESKRAREPRPPIITRLTISWAGTRRCQIFDARLPRVDTLSLAWLGFGCNRQCWTERVYGWKESRSSSKAVLARRTWYSFENVTKSLHPKLRRYYKW